MILAPFVNYNMGAKIPVSAEAAQNYSRTVQKPHPKNFALEKRVGFKNSIRE
jgi:hypothetical protein